VQAKEWNLIIKFVEPSQNPGKLKLGRVSKKFLKNQTNYGVIFLSTTVKKKKHGMKSSLLYGIV
jgi:hypothetical protein